jgi:hypothetical protein
MPCEHTDGLSQVCCSSDLGCFGSENDDSSTKRVLLWLENECSQADAMQFIVANAEALAIQAQSAEPEDQTLLSTLKYAAKNCSAWNAVLLL